MVDIQINKQITAKVTTTSGGPISTYNWKLDDVFQSNNTDTLIIQPNTLSIGTHTIKFRGQNYCDNWSSELVENINITEVIYMPTQTDPVVVNEPAVAVTITLRRISDVTVTVIEDPQAQNPGAPVLGATVDIAGIIGTTDANGVVVLSNIPYATDPPHNALTTYT